MPFLIATLAGLSTTFPVDDLGNRLQVTVTLLLTLTGISYSASESLPKLPYSTKLDHYHESCHFFVLLVVLENVLFSYAANECKRCGNPTPATTTSDGVATEVTSASDSGCAERTGGLSFFPDLYALTGASEWCTEIERYETNTMVFIVVLWFLWNVVTLWRAEQELKRSPSDK